MTDFEKELISYLQSWRKENKLLLDEKIDHALAKFEKLEHPHFSDFPNMLAKLIITEITPMMIAATINHLKEEGYLNDKK